MLYKMRQLEFDPKEVLASSAQVKYISSQWSTWRMTLLQCSIFSTICDFIFYKTSCTFWFHFWIYLAWQSYHSVDWCFKLLRTVLKTCETIGKCKKGLMFVLIHKVPAYSNARASKEHISKWRNGSQPYQCNLFA